MALVYEYMSGGTLEDKLRGVRYSICVNIWNFPLKLFCTDDLLQGGVATLDR
jgi:activator of 2-hydroxyglutaryl-CoA dehydratase